MSYKAARCKRARPRGGETLSLPKEEGELGVINLETHKNAMLLKFLYKFFNRMDIPWVHLIWDNHYQNDKLPGC